MREVIFAKVAAKFFLGLAFGCLCFLPGVLAGRTWQESSKSQPAAMSDSSFIGDEKSERLVGATLAIDSTVPIDEERIPRAMIDPPTIESTPNPLPSQIETLPPAPPEITKPEPPQRRPFRLDTKPLKTSHAIGFKSIALTSSETLGEACCESCREAAATARKTLDLLTVREAKTTRSVYQATPPPVTYTTPTVTYSASPPVTYSVPTYTGSFSADCPSGSCSTSFVNSRPGLLARIFGR
jgi:hypothetical protein